MGYRALVLVWGHRMGSQGATVSVDLLISCVGRQECVPILGAIQELFHLHRCVEGR